MVKLVLRSTDMYLAVGAKTVQDGIAAPGMFHVTEPGTRAAALFRGPYDALHLYVPDRLMRECAGSLHRDGSSSLPSMAALARDPAVDSLARALMNAELSQGEVSILYVDCISIALVARLLHTAVPSTGSKRTKVAEMARWRLKRAIEFIETGLEQTLSLADIAGASGLSRMHFAAQFRASTGLRPHEYVLRRRVERAQEMLARTERPIVDIAMSVGFQTQSHFTTIFKRFAGQTPQAWRRSFAGS
ncbi:helix-turn-helix domain-containing protein [Dongia sp. agr-C8]